MKVKIEQRIRQVLFSKAAACAGSIPRVVLDVFLDEGLEFDGVIGVSAGAVHGCSFLSGQRGEVSGIIKILCGQTLYER